MNFINRIRILTILCSLIEICNASERDNKTQSPTNDAMRPIYMKCKGFPKNTTFTAPIPSKQWLMDSVAKAKIFKRSLNGKIDATTTTTITNEFQKMKGKKSKKNAFVLPITPGSVEPRLTSTFANKIERVGMRNLQIAPPNKIPSWNQRVGLGRMAFPGRSPPVMPLPDKNDLVLKTTD